MHISSPEKSWWALAGLISLKFNFILPLKSAQLILCFLSKKSGLALDLLHLIQYCMSMADV